MSSILWLDYETRSECDLLKAGVYNYAAHLSTRVLIASYALDNGPVKRWEAWKRPNLPMDLRKYLMDKRITIRAHNATFERLITKHCLGIDIPASRWYCTSYQSRSAGCPSSLDDLARMVNPAHRKDARGMDLIRRYSCPPFENDAAGLTEFGEYCDRDVEITRALSKALPPLTDEARRVWVANEVINDRGLPIDTELCELAQAYMEREIEALEARMVKLTGTKTRGQAVAQWVYERLTEDQAELMHKEGGKVSLDKAARQALLELDLPPMVQEVLEIMDGASMSSTAKFGNFLRRTSSDGRLRGAFVAAGASATGRYASWGVQLHNLPRMSAKDPEALKRKMKRRQPVTPEELKSMLRPAICAGPGKHIVRCDWNAIEARGLPWLVNTPESNAYLGAFRDPTRDIYIEQAKAAGLGEARQEGKVVVLSLGYGGAVGALSKMAKAYGVAIPDPDKVVKRWRQANPWARQWWDNLMSIAGKSLREDTIREAGRVRFVGSGVMELPSGRYVYYPGLQRDAEDGLVYLKAAKKPKKGEPWPLTRLWHGVIAENATQAACCDLLRDLTVREQDSPLIGHVHDECIAECDNKKDGETWLQDAMLRAPKWAKDFPLAAKAESAKRFGK
jgi:DNA polymerase